MKIIEFDFNPIGTTFEQGDVTLKVVETKNPQTCKGCWYAGQTNGIRNYSRSCVSHKHACTSGNRKDRKQVIFVKTTN